MGLSRRDLLTKVMPACTLTCIAPYHAFGMPEPGRNKFQYHKFDTEMKMVRDKTFMQGDSCCNHRYVYKT